MKVSVLNLIPRRVEDDFQTAIAKSIRLAQAVEGYGYERYWIAEHHNMKSVASSATQLLIQHTLAQTERLRVGSGGVMLPNHSPYLVAEQYGTLEILYPGRLDLGLGRAPGTDMETARALRRTDNLYPDFANDLAELQAYFDDTAAVHAYPAAGLQVPFFILGSSTDSAYLAARLGLPYSFAAHFAPAMMEEAIAIYRNSFQPSSQLAEPYVILGVNAILADSDTEAERLATSQTQAFLNIVTNNQTGIQPPVASEEVIWDNYVASQKVPHFGPIAFRKENLIHQEKAVVAQMGAVSLIGSPETAKQQLAELRSRVHFDEIMANSYIYDEAAQHHSYQLLAEVAKAVD